MTLQTSLFWLSGAAFFAVQLGMLLYLLRQSRIADPETAAQGRLEIVWTLVPASLIAALALMLGGLTTGSWTDRDLSRDDAAGLAVRWAGPETEPASEPPR